MPTLAEALAALNTLNQFVQGGSIAATAPSIPAPLPVDPAAPVSGKYGEIPYHDDMGNRVDNIVAPGTPGTVTLPLTGHVLSLPQVADKEMIGGYTNRVRVQCGHTGPFTDYGAYLAGGGIGYAAGHFGGFKADGSNWPQIADFWFNAQAYKTPEELAKDAESAAQWAQYAIDFAKNHPPGGKPADPPPPAAPPVVLPPGETPL